MSNVKVNIDQVIDFINPDKFSGFQQHISGIYQSLYNKTGIGNDFMGWVSLPSGFSDEIIDQIQNTAKEIRDRADILVVIGIGGSYLGARAIRSSYANNNQDISTIPDFFCSILDLINNFIGKP